MEFYVEEVVKIKDQATAAAVTVKEDEREARMLFHQILASAYANKNLESVMVQITNEYGGNIELENWRESLSETTED